MTISVLHPPGVAGALPGAPLPGAHRMARQTASRTPCRSNDPELWFAEAPSEVERAKSLCGACPVRSRCLDEAIARREPWGVWGGELLLQGVVVARKRPRGRPRKDERQLSA